MPGRGNVLRGKADRGASGRGPGAEQGRGREASADELGGERGDSHGRSASSPGHLKKAAGVQSARDFAPGRRGDLERPDQDEGETLT